MWIVWNVVGVDDQPHHQASWLHTSKAVEAGHSLDNRYHMFAKFEESASFGFGFAFSANWSLAHQMWPWNVKKLEKLIILAVTLYLIISWTLEFASCPWPTWIWWSAKRWLTKWCCRYCVCTCSGPVWCIFLCCSLSRALSSGRRRRRRRAHKAATGPPLRLFWRPSPPPSSSSSVSFQWLIYLDSVIFGKAYQNRETEGDSDKENLKEFFCSSE